MERGRLFAKGRSDNQLASMILGLAIEEIPERLKTNNMTRKLYSPVSLSVFRFSNDKPRKGKVKAYR